MVFTYKTIQSCIVQVFTRQNQQAVSKHSSSTQVVEAQSQVEQAEELGSTRRRRTKKSLVFEEFISKARI